MKKVIILLILFMATTATGCKFIVPSTPQKPSQPAKPMEEPLPQLEEDAPLPEEEAPLPEESPEQRISDDGILRFPEGTITLLAYEDEMNLPETLGMPLVEETIVLENADTFTGSYEKTLIYQDARLVLFSPPQDGQRFYLISIETENENVTTNRGITLGDTLEDMQQAYPEVTRSLDGTTGTDGRYEMMFQENPYTYLLFYVEEGKVIKIQLLHEFA